MAVTVALAESVTTQMLPVADVQPVQLPNLPMAEEGGEVSVMAEPAAYLRVKGTVPPGVLEASKGVTATATPVAGPVDETVRD